ncbi:MAG: four helix bundle protein [Bacteroidia bacterium]
MSLDKLTRFEDFRIWQQARNIAKIIYEFTKREAWFRDYRFQGQARASAGSIMDNFAEGFERGGNKEFSNFLSISKASAGELKSQLYRALDQNYISKEEFESTYELLDQCIRQIGKLISYLNQSSFKGSKFNNRVSDPEVLYAKEIMKFPNEFLIAPHDESV